MTCPSRSAIATFFSKAETIVFQKNVFLHVFNILQTYFTPMKSIFKHGLLLLAFILGLAFPLLAQSTLMTIHLNDGTERNYYMSEDDRVYFEDNETLVIELAPTKSDRYSLADIRKITCTETENVSEAPNAPVLLYPNPAHDALLLQNLKGKQNISIYALDGRIVKSFETAGDQWIDISDLPIGLYLVKTEHQTLKMIKL